MAAGDPTAQVLSGATVCLILNVLYMDGRAKLEAQALARLRPKLDDLYTKLLQGRVDEMPAITGIRTERNDQHEVTRITAETAHPDGARTTLSATASPDAISGASPAEIELTLPSHSQAGAAAQLAWLNGEGTCWVGQPYQTSSRGKPRPTLVIRQGAARALLEAIGRGPVIMTDGTAACHIKLPPADRTTIRAFRLKHTEESDD